SRHFVPSELSCLSGGGYPSLSTMSKQRTPTPSLGGRPGHPHRNRLYHRYISIQKKNLQILARRQMRRFRTASRRLRTDGSRAVLGRSDRCDRGGEFPDEGKSRFSGCRPTG